MKSRKFYIVFEDYQPSKWKWFHFIFCFTPWKHCWLIEDFGATTVTINYLASHVSVYSYMAKAEVVAPWFLENPAVKDIVKISLISPQNEKYTVRGLLNCVTLIKSTLGIGKTFIVTPKQLYSHLLSNGGISMKGLKP